MEGGECLQQVQKLHCTHLTALRWSPVQGLNNWTEHTVGDVSNWRAIPESAWVNSGVLLFGVSCPFVRSTRSNQNKRNKFQYHCQHSYQSTFIKYKANAATRQGKGLTGSVRVRVLKSPQPVRSVTVPIRHTLYLSMTAC